LLCSQGSYIKVLVLDRLATEIQEEEQKEKEYNTHRLQYIKVCKYLEGPLGTIAIQSENI